MLLRNRLKRAQHDTTRRKGSSNKRSQLNFPNHSPERERTTTHELCRFRAGFAGLPKTKPAKFRGCLNSVQKPYQGMFIDGLCRFAGLIPSGEPKKYKNSTERNNVAILWIT